MLMRIRTKRQLTAVFRVKRRSGMTLPEILISMVIFLALFSGVMAMTDASQKYWASNKVRINLQQQLRIAAIRMATDLRQGSSIINVPADGAAHSGSIEFTKRVDVTSGNPATDWTDIIYSIEAGADGNEFHRTEDGNAIVIGRNITNAEFTRMAEEPDVIQISLTAQEDTIYGRSITNDLTFSFEMRN